MSVYQYIEKKRGIGEKMLALLLDPDSYNEVRFEQLAEVLKRTMPSLVFVGGSLVTADTALFVERVKLLVDVPVVLFPGNVSQLAPSADAVLFISLISGRNPEFLIGQQVVAAPAIRRIGIEAISTGYMLIDGGRTTSVQYMSNSLPIPSDKVDIAVATALAGEILGMKLLYLEAGSGALNPVPHRVIASVVNEVSIPVIVGGGLNTSEKISAACNAGADIVVVGNALEKDIAMLEEFSRAVASCSRQQSVD